MNHLERFLGVMEYEPVDRVTSWEIAAWEQTIERWRDEGMDAGRYHWDWFPGERELGMDPREFIAYDGGLLPPFERELLYEDDRTETYRTATGEVRRSLKAGTVAGQRASMDMFVGSPVQKRADWEEMKKRLDPACPKRFESNWQDIRVESWHNRTHPLIFAPNCGTLGFYWTARAMMGTEGASYGWYDEPELMHDMMEFRGDFLIEAARPVLEETTVEYICLNEDMAMKTGPLLSPDTYREFIYPHLKRVVEFYKGNGVRYVAIDSDGNMDALTPLLLDAGVDAVWPLERAADQDPVRLRKLFGKSLRLWGGVDKRELAKDANAIDAHLKELRPLIEEGGYIPTVDHAIPPDVSLANFLHYLESKAKLLRGEL